MGSSNLDAQSLLTNLALNVWVQNEALATALDRLFKEDLRGAREVTPEWCALTPLSERLLSWLFLQLHRWL